MCLACVPPKPRGSGPQTSRRRFFIHVAGAGGAVALGMSASSLRARAQSGNAATPGAGLSAVDRYLDLMLPASSAQPRDGAIAVTFLGTTSLLFDDGQTKIMIDGFISRPSLQTVLEEPLQTDTAAVDLALTRIGADQLDALFVAHSHWDHALDAAYIAETTGARLFGSASTLNIGRGGGLSEDQLSLFAPGTPLSFGAFTVTVLPSKHSPPLPGVNDDLGKEIVEPLAQPAPVSAYVEGGSFDFLIAHGDNAMLVKPSANFIEGALDGVRADVLFLGTATLSNQDPAFQHALYEQSVGTVQPQLVIPVHWDDFFLPLSERLEALDPADLTASFDYLIDRLRADGRQFGIMQGYQTVLFFAE